MKFIVTLIPIYLAFLILLPAAGIFAAHPAAAQGGGNPKAQAIIKRMSSAERKEFFSLSRPERRAYIRQRLGKGREAPPAPVSKPTPPSGGTVTAPIQGLYFIDAHSQMDENVDEARVISLMDHAGVYRTILSNHMRRPWSDIPKFAKSRPGRIVPSVRIKGRGYHGRGSAVDFYERLSAQINSGAHRSMSEVHLWHDSDGGKYQEIKVDFEDKLVLAAFAGARKKGWPFIIHIEFASLSDGGRNSYMQKLGAFLKANPEHNFILIHMAQLEESPVRRLLDAHPNLYFMMSHASTFYQGRGKPFINMFDGHAFKPNWKKLIGERPDRFIFALDNVFSRFWTPELYLAKMELWWRALAQLPAPAAHALAHGNAERLWKLAPKPADAIAMPPWIAKDKLGPVTGHSAGRMQRGRRRR